jgi:hypothetical protein
MINPDRIYNTAEASRLTWLASKAGQDAFTPVARLSHLCRTGKLKASKVGGRWLIRGDHLRDYVVRMGLEVD